MADSDRPRERKRPPARLFAWTWRILGALAFLGIVVFSFHKFTEDHEWSPLAGVVRAAVFLLAFVSVYVFAAAFLIRGLVFRLRGRKAAPSRTMKWVRRAAYGLAVSGTLCVLYGYFIEPNWPEVVRVQVATPRLPAGSRPVRIVQISNLHSEGRPRLEEKLPGIVAALAPDLIVFTGDTLNEPEGLPVFRKCMARLAEIAPTFSVDGNWDQRWPELDRFSGTGVHRLAGEAIEVNAGGTQVWIAGIAVEGWDSQSRAALARPPAEACIIFLCHKPDWAPQAAATRRIALYCAGHTHGGQVSIPYYGALVTNSQLDKRFESGLYREGDMPLYVNRGLGLEGGYTPRVRFWSRPEITLLELRPEE